MKKKIKDFAKKAVIVCSLVLSVIVFTTIVDEKPTFADSGFSTSHSSSSGSSSSSSSSSHSSSSHSSSYSSGSSHSSSGGSASITDVFVFIILIIIYLFYVKAKKNTGDSNGQKIPDDTAIENRVKQYIPDFNKAQFLNEGYEIYKNIQEAWMDFKLEDVRDLITDELYSMYESQLTTLEVKGEQNIMKGFDLRTSYLKDVVKQNDTITITTGYVIDFYDYIAEQGTGKVIRGEANRKMRVTYEMKFRKTLNESAKVENCPNCGAPVEVNSSGICEYCGAKLVAENIKWVLTEKKSLDQKYI